MIIQSNKGDKMEKPWSIKLAEKVQELENKYMGKGEIPEAIITDVIWDLARALLKLEKSQ
jgi:hypothetical protein